MHLWSSILHIKLLYTCLGMLKQMEEDKCRFGAAAWASAAPRLEKLRFLLAKEALQHMRAREMCLNRKKDSIREEVHISLFLNEQTTYFSSGIVIAGVFYHCVLDSVVRRKFLFRSLFPVPRLTLLL